MNPSIDPKPPRIISNVESDVEEDEVSTTEEQTDDEEVVKLQGMWGFILPNEDTQEAIPIATWSRSLVDLPQTNAKQKVSTLDPKDKTTAKKYSSKSTQTSPSQSNYSPVAKIMIIFDEMEYKIVDDMKNTKVNITLHELAS